MGGRPKQVWKEDFLPEGGGERSEARESRSDLTMRRIWGGQSPEWEAEKGKIRNSQRVI